MGCGPSKPSKSKKGGGGGGGKKSGGGKKAGGGQAGGVLGESQELQNYDPIRYENNEAVVRDPHRIVTQVHFVAQTVLESGGNHWGICLQTGPCESIRLNMDPSNVLGAQAPNHGYRGRLYIRYRDHAITNNQEKIVTIPANPGHSVAQFIDVIINEGNHLYDLTTRGRGCTGWILDQFILFEHYHLIPGGYNLAKVIGQQWEDGHATKPDIGVTRGTYMRNTTYGGWAGRGALRRR
ncbi:uncharacterized protein PAC_05133 [Phialocephala subalpina]|uniref:DUF7770 domain-containing protein n=1 Tax=Phialocephala subalpina TaxID=576137 RepID=A0A1L7WR57_9HELO|nr:uncharacterized protein PAC_05133 [Phialocephala subalpina]